MYRVLLVEDDSQIRQVIGDYFGRRDQIVLDFAEDGNLGLSKILNEEYDLFLLDIMMPGLDGFELCKIIRRRSDKPIVFLTGKVREEDILYGYELGADDYIVKPFSIAVLYKKLLAILERAKTEHVERKILSSGQIELDPLKFEVRVAGDVVDLPPKEYAILKYMMEHPGVAVTRRLLLETFGDGLFDAYEKKATVSRRLSVSGTGSIKERPKKDGRRRGGVTP